MPHCQYHHFWTLTTLMILSIGSLTLAATNAASCVPISNLTSYKQCLQQLDQGCTELHIMATDLCPLPDSVFTNLTSLEIINLMAHQLTILPAKIFSKTLNLSMLYLDSNLLQELPSGLFALTSKLQSLSLNHNQITALPLHVFDKTMLSRGTFSMDNNPLQCTSVLNLDKSCNCIRGVFVVDKLNSRVYCQLSSTSTNTTTTTITSTTTTTSSSTGKNTTTTTTSKRTTTTKTTTDPDLSTIFSSTSTSSAEPLHDSEPRNAKTISIISGVVAGSITLSLLLLIAYTRAAGAQPVRGPFVPRTPLVHRTPQYRELPTFSDVDDIEMEHGAEGL